MHLIQNFFLWAHNFRVGVTQNGNLDGIRGHTYSCMHRHMYTATYRTVCYGWRVGIVHSIVIVTATAGPDCDLLTYLTGAISEIWAQVGPLKKRGTVHRQSSYRATERPSW